MTNEFIEIIARKKCVTCKQYMPKEILTPKCRKCYEDCHNLVKGSGFGRVTVSTTDSITLL